MFSDLSRKRPSRLNVSVQSDRSQTVENEGHGKTLAGTGAVLAGTRHADERLRCGVFAQDLAQELDQSLGVLAYVLAEVRTSVELDWV